MLGYLLNVSKNYEEEEEQIKSNQQHLLMT
jgi:hypothetical protein